jgi:endoglucanase
LGLSALPLILLLGGSDSAPVARRYGAYVATEPWPDVTSHLVLEEKIGAKLPTMSWFQDWGTPWLTRQASAAAESGHDLLICWEPTINRDPVRFSEIVDGVYDSHLEAYFSAAADHPRPVMMRPFHEMNGDWYPWARAHGRRDVVSSIEEWIAAWQHLVLLQRRVSGDHIKWLWCVNYIDIGGFPAEWYFPGEEYVDAVGMDCYNGYGPWESFYQLAAPMYNRLIRLKAKVPVVVAETGCREPTAAENRSKAAWLQELFDEDRLPRLTNINFFSSNKKHDWRLDSSVEALQTMRRNLAR